MIDFKSYQPENNADVLVVELSGRMDSESAETFFERQQFPVVGVGSVYLA